MSLYQLPDSVRALLRLERFEADNFSSKQFIELLSRTQSHALADDDIDPKPYIRTFEAVANELQNLSDAAGQKEAAALKDTDELVEAHNLNVIDMHTNVETAMADVKHLDEQISEITRATSLLGDRLERLSREHRQIADSRQLTTHYLSFLRHGSSPELEKLWSSTDTDDRRKCAQVVGQLQLLARKIGDIPGHPTVESEIDKFAERLETHLVNIFQDAYTAFDLVGMREIADILYEFNGGSSVMQAFVNQHDFFMQIDKLEDDTALKEPKLWEELTDPMSEYPELEKVVQNLVDEIVEVVINETDIITRVFPKPVQVLSIFMQRVFAQRVQGQVLLYTQEAESYSMLAQARVLFVCYQKISLMVKTLKDVWSKQQVDADGELAQMLDANFADTFTLFINDSYFKSHEIPILREIISTAFAPFFAALSSEPEANGRHASDGILNSGPSVDRGGSDVLEETKEESMATNLDKFMKAARGRAGSSSVLGRLRDKGSDNQPREEAGLLQLSSLQLVLSAFAESVGREQVLRRKNDVVRDITLLFNLLMEEVGGKYINASLENAGRRAEQDLKSTVSWAFLDATHRGANAVQLLAAFVKSVLLLMMRTSDLAQNEMAESINQYITSAQELCTYVLEQASTLAHQKTQQILGRQKRRDFAPKEGDEISDATSNTCDEILQMLEDLGEQANVSLIGSNKVAFLKDIAHQLYDDLTQHIKNHSINKAGGDLLAADAAAYENLIVNDWGLTEMAENFGTLRAVSKLFTSEPSLLPSLMRDSHLERLEPSVLREYVSLRNDYHLKNLHLVFLQKVKYRY